MGKGKSLGDLRDPPCCSEQQRWEQKGGRHTLRKGVHLAPACQALQGRKKKRLDTEEEAGGLLPVQPLLRIAEPPPTSQYSHSDTGWS
jgi:hypothetical protein